ncbi:MAG: exodeoxyribonuclease VII large subunit [Microthrixaceae bacterium]|nr:exodeoxyribonuclease VII large subunit [Microthrixaceae bacterium]
MASAPFEPPLFSLDEPTDDASGEPHPPVEHTWSVPELYGTLSYLIEGRFGSSTWVTGELRSLSSSPKGHRYFELIEPGSEDDYNTPRLKVTLFAGNRKRVNATLRETGSAVQIEEGTILRICGELRPYAARSTLQLVMTGIDPSYTLGVVGRRREAVLAALRAEDLIGANARLEVPYPSIDVALITSMGSAAAADTLHELERARVGFRLVTLDSRTQGAEAEPSIVAALRTAEDLSVDVVLLVRGGGSASDLSVFDSELIARTIAGLSVPVFTGIGHETDRSVADEVAHTAHKTPTAAAAAIVTAAIDARRSLEQAAASVRSAASGTVVRAERDLLGAARRERSPAVRISIARTDCSRPAWNASGPPPRRPSTG